MKKRLFAVIAALSAGVALLTAVGMALFYYHFYLENAKAQIRGDCALLALGLAGAADEGAVLLGLPGALPAGARVTLVDKGGAVLFDTALAAGTLPSHAGRAELVAAQEEGSGEAVRHSDTLGADTFYYAVRLGDGRVLRFSRPLGSIAWVFADTLPLVALCIAALLALSLAAASLLTRALVRPISQAGAELEGMLGDPPPPQGAGRAAVYEELAPFVGKIGALRAQVRGYVRTLQEEKETIQRIIQGMREGLVLLGADKTVLAVNKSAGALLGAPGPAACQGRGLIHLSRDLRLQQAVDEVLTGGCAATYDDTDAQGRCRRFYLSPVVKEGGAAEGAMVFIMDVTQEARAQRLRRDFAANVSHELKTPLTSINGFAEMLENGMIRGEEEVRGACARIHREASRLIALIEDIMRLSEIESGAVPGERELCVLRDIVEEAAGAVEQAAAARGVRVSCQCDGTKLLANGAMLYELVFNLADNAVKYNRAGGNVLITAHREGEEAEIAVTDTGLGIPAEHRARIFERFYRVDKSRSKQTGGTGLGLSIVKHIVEWHGGAIAVESEPGRGTTMRVRLPILPGRAEDKGRPCKNHP